MFDIGFWELVVIAVLGLVVLGPERLPMALRTGMQWVRSMRSMVNNVKQDISQELHLHELHENLKKAERSNLNDLSPELQASVDALQQAAQSVQRPYEVRSDSRAAEPIDELPASTPDPVSVAQPKKLERDHD